MAQLNIGNWIIITMLLVAAIVEARSHNNDLQRVHNNKNEHMVSDRHKIRRRQRGRGRKARRPGHGNSELIGKQAWLDDFFRTRARQQMLKNQLA